jgi:hypothetical protein
MALTLKDRVLETCTAPGTGSVSLLGAVTGYQSFSSAIGNANTCYYTIADQSGANWEVGIGTYTSSGNTLARTTVLSSSNGGSLTNFASGTQNVFVTYPSEEAVYSNGTNIVGPSGIPLAVGNGGTGLTSLTSGYIPYGNGTSAFNSSSNLQYSGSQFLLSGTGGVAGASDLFYLNVTSSYGGMTLNATSGNNTFVELYQAGTTKRAEYGIDSTNSLVNIGGFNGYGLKFLTNGAEVGRFTTSGYLGIGTSSPTAQLTVANDASISGLTVGKGGGAVSSNTAVGGGNTLISNTTGAGNLGVGYNVLAVNTTGNFNTAVGSTSPGYYPGALNGNTTGAWNVALGTGALASNSTGSYNTGIGSACLQSNTTASNNTAVGYQAGYSNTTGTSNQYVGYQTGYTNSTGSNNAGFGYLTLINNTASFNTGFGSNCLNGNSSGANNTAIGYNALYGNTTASNNTAVGYQAGYSNTVGGSFVMVGYQAGFFNTADWTVAVGRQALYNNSTGVFNTALGGQTLVANTTGGSNTGLGYNALFSNTTGFFNTAVGYQAGYSNTTGAYNSFMGYKAGYGNTTGSSNTIIGYAAGQAAITGSGNTLIGQGSGTSLTSGNKNTFIGGGDQGTNYPSGYFVTTGSSNTILGAYSGNNGGLDIRTASNYIVLSDGDGNPRLISDNAGNIGMGAFGAAPAQGLFAYTVSSSYLAIGHASGSASGNTYLNFYYAGGQIGSVSQTGTTAVLYNTTSDYRLKSDVTPITNALTIIEALNPVSFTWTDGRKDDGFLAHELQAVIPNCVTGEKDAVNEDGTPKYQQMDNSGVIPFLVKAIQELKAEFDAYKATHP